VILVDDGAKKHSFWPFLLENSVVTAAKKFDIFTVSRIDTMEHFKKKIVQIRWVENEIQVFSCWKRNRTIRAQFTHIGFLLTYSVIKKSFQHRFNEYIYQTSWHCEVLSLKNKTQFFFCSHFHCISKQMYWSELSHEELIDKEKNLYFELSRFRLVSFLFTSSSINVISRYTFKVQQA
jgi:hypothetical protein